MGVVGIVCDGVSYAVLGVVVGIGDCVCMMYIVVLLFVAVGVDRSLGSSAGADHSSVAL